MLQKVKTTIELLLTHEKSIPKTFTLEIIDKTDTYGFCPLSTSPSTLFLTDNIKLDGIPTKIK